jgi:hypothetical protein
VNAVGIGDHEIHALNLAQRHLIHRVAATATDPDDTDYCTLALAIHQLEHFRRHARHYTPPELNSDCSFLDFRRTDAGEQMPLANTSNPNLR